MQSVGELNDGIIADGENVTSYTYGVGATLPTPTKSSLQIWRLV